MGLLRAFLFKSKYSALVNVAANAEVIPEFIQTRFRSDLIAQRSPLEARAAQRMPGACL